MPNKIYLASSWRNEHIDTVRDALRVSGHDVYDFRENEGFNWTDVQPDWNGIDPVPVDEFVTMLDHQRSQAAHERDVSHLLLADICVLILPCNKSAHTELGMAIMRGKFTVVYTPGPLQPELMYASCNHVTDSIEQLRVWAETNIYNPTDG